MRTCLFVTLFSCLFMGVSLAQEQIKPMPTTVTGQNCKLYVNKDLGVFLWISVSPDENSEKFRLFSDSSKKYTNPMYFDTQGYNTIRHRYAVDTNTKRIVYPKRDVIFKVYADGLPPVSRVHVIGKLSENKKYYTDSMNIEIKAIDAVSGVDKIYYSMAGENFSEYKSPISITTEGDHLIKYYSTDKVGNCEEVKSLNITIKK